MRAPKVVFDRMRAGARPNEWDNQFAISALETDGVEVSYQTTFQASGDGKTVWRPIAKDGRLANDSKSWVSDKEEFAGAIAVRFTLQPGEKRVIPIVIGWDSSVIQFGEGRRWERRYTDFYGTSGPGVCGRDGDDGRSFAFGDERGHLAVPGAEGRVVHVEPVSAR
jgi:non-lysosomal glucosylceramidase